MRPVAAVMTPFMHWVRSTGTHDHVQRLEACRASTGGRRQTPGARSGNSAPVEIRGLDDPAKEENYGSDERLYHVSH